MQVRIFFIVIMFFNFASFAKEKKPQEQKPIETILTNAIADVTIVDKIYVRTVKEKLPVGKSFFYKNLQINVERCKKNNKNQTFAFLSISENQKSLFESWVPIDDYNIAPLKHSNFDVTVQSCYIPLGNR